MKTKNLLILVLASLLVIVIAVVIFMLSQEKVEHKESNTQDKVFQTVLAEKDSVPAGFELQGTLVPGTVKKLQFTVGGTLEKGDVDFRSGASFQFNQLLCKVNIREVFLALAEQKNRLKETMSSMLPEIKGRVPAEYAKWQAFYAELDPRKRLPAFPIINLDKESDLLREGSFLKEYSKTATLEETIEKHFYLAPFDGTFLQINKKPGAKIKSGTVVATFAKKNSYRVQLTANYTQALKLGFRTSLVFLDDNGNSLGTGQVVKKTANDKKEYQLICSFQPKGKSKCAFGQKVHVKYGNPFPCTRVPATAVKEGVVLIMQGQTITERKVDIFKIENENAYLGGIRPGEVVVLR